jgi:hypothetical protein
VSDRCVVGMPGLLLRFEEWEIADAASMSFEGDLLDWQQPEGGTVADAMEHVVEISPMLDLRRASEVHEWAAALTHDSTGTDLSIEEFDRWKNNVLRTISQWIFRMINVVPPSSTTPSVRSVPELPRATTVEAGVEARESPPPQYERVASAETVAVPAAPLVPASVGGAPSVVGSLAAPMSMPSLDEMMSRTDTMPRIIDGAMTEAEVSSTWRRIYTTFHVDGAVDQQTLMVAVLRHTLDAGTSDKINSTYGVELSGNRVVYLNAVYEIVRSTGRTLRQFMRGQAAFAHAYLNRNPGFHPRWGQRHMRPYNRTFAFDYADYVPHVTPEVVDALNSARRRALRGKSVAEPQD